MPELLQMLMNTMCLLILFFFRKNVLFDEVSERQRGMMI